MVPAILEQLLVSTIRPELLCGVRDGVCGICRGLAEASLPTKPAKALLAPAWPGRMTPPLESSDQAAEGHGLDPRCVSE